MIWSNNTSADQIKLYAALGQFTAEWMSQWMFMRLNLKPSLWLITLIVWRKTKVAPVQDLRVFTELPFHVVVF